MNAYQRFAYSYDDVFQELDYTLWLDFIEPYLTDTSHILDVACGSGTLAILLKLKGYTVEGLDLSSSIIDIAKEKAKMHHLSIPFYVADMTKFQLANTYDMITCFFDSVNFLKTDDELADLFQCVHTHLNPNGLFIFDLFSKTLLAEYKNHKLVKQYVTHDLLWTTNRTDEKTLEHKIQIQEGNECFEECYYEYYHILQNLPMQGFDVIKVCGDFNDDLEDEDERILVVLRKK